MSVCLEESAESAFVTFPSYFNETQKKIARLLTTDVRKDCASSSYGFPGDNAWNRMNLPWERPEFYNSFYYNYYSGVSISAYINTFDHLCDTLTYVSSDDSAFQEYFKGEAGGSYDAGDYSNFVVPSLNKHFLWCDAHVKPYVGVTDQSINYWYPFKGKDKSTWADLIVLRICGGPDKLKDYTDPVLFHINQFAVTGEFYNPTVLGEIYCPCCKSMWEKKSYVYWPPIDQCPGLLPFTEYKAKRGDKGEKGFVVVAKHSEAYCPVCGEGKLV